MVLLMFRLVRAPVPPPQCAAPVFAVAGREADVADIAAEEWNGYLVDFQMDEPMIAQAIAQITGQKPEAPATRSVVRVPFRKADVRVPEVAPIHPQGMITLPVRKDVAQ